MTKKPNWTGWFNQKNCKSVMCSVQLTLKTSLEKTSELVTIEPIYLYLFLEKKYYHLEKQHCFYLILDTTFKVSDTI